MASFSKKQFRLRGRSARRIQSMQLLTAKPVIKNVDVEAVKKEFEAAKAAK